MSYLLADIGGTNIRIMLLNGSEITSLHYYKTSDYRSITEVLTDYLKTINEQPEKMIFSIITSGLLALIHTGISRTKKLLTPLGSKIKPTLFNLFI